jgi:hypothetical protein
VSDVAVKRWAIILCRLGDVPGEPHPPSFYRNFFTESGAGTGGAFDYWRDVTYGTIDLTGSRVFGWFTIPQTTADYEQLRPSFPAARWTLLSWGLAAAQANAVDLAPFSHRAIVFNTSTDSGAVGGTDAVLGMGTWHPAFACHEMGHGMGLDHAWRANPDQAYGDPWDVMSLFTSYFPFDGAYGQSGPGLVAPHLDRLRCLPAARVLDLPVNDFSARVVLAALNRPSAPGYLAVKLAGSRAGNACDRTYYFELRRKVDWDAGIPRDTVLAHEVRADGLSYLLGDGTDHELQVGDRLRTISPKLHAWVESIDPSSSTAAIWLWDLPDRAVRREGGSRDVYLIWGGARFLISSTDELYGLGFSEQDVKPVPDQALAGLDRLPFDGTILRERRSLDRYYIQHRRRRLIPSDSVFAHFGFTGEQVGVVPDGALARIPVGFPLSAGQSLTARTGGDFSGDGRTDYAVWRVSDGRWRVRRSSTGTAFDYQWGQGGDVPVPADYNGDGWTEMAVWRPADGTWWRSGQPGGTPQATLRWGAGGDIPVPADYDGDGRADIAVFRPYEANWYVVFSSDDSRWAVRWGEAGDVPVPGDYDGDGRTNLAVWRPRDGTWHIRRGVDCTSLDVAFGQPGDVPVPADFDGDGKTDLAVWRPSDGTWRIRFSSTGQELTKQWGRAGDVPVPGDYDGDGKADLAVWRPADGIWWVLTSASNYQTAANVQHGQSGDQPAVRAP